MMDKTTKSRSTKRKLKRDAISMIKVKNLIERLEKAKALALHLVNDKFTSLLLNSDPEFLSSSYIESLHKKYPRFVKRTSLKRISEEITEDFENQSCASIKATVHLVIPRQNDNSLIVTPLTQVALLPALDDDRKNDLLSIRDAIDSLCRETQIEHREKEKSTQDSGLGGEVGSTFVISYDLTKELNYSKSKSDKKISSSKNIQTTNEVIPDKVEEIIKHSKTDSSNEAVDDIKKASKIKLEETKNSSTESIIQSSMMHSPKNETQLMKLVVSQHQTSSDTNRLITKLAESDGKTTKEQMVSSQPVLTLNSCLKSRYFQLPKPQLDITGKPKKKFMSKSEAGSQIPVLVKSTVQKSSQTQKFYIEPISYNTLMLPSMRL